MDFCTPGPASSGLQDTRQSHLSPQTHLPHSVAMPGSGRQPATTLWPCPRDTHTHQAFVPRRAVAWAWAGQASSSHSLYLHRSWHFWPGRPALLTGRRIAFPWLAENLPSLPIYTAAAMTAEGGGGGRRTADGTLWLHTSNQSIDPAKSGSRHHRLGFRKATTAWRGGGAAEWPAADGAGRTAAAGRAWHGGRRQAEAQARPLSLSLYADGVGEMIPSLLFCNPTLPHPSIPPLHFLLPPCCELPHTGEEEEVRQGTDHSGGGGGQGGLFLDRQWEAQPCLAPFYTEQPLPACMHVRIAFSHHLKSLLSISQEICLYQKIGL